MAPKTPKPRQRTLESTLGQSRVKTVIKPHKTPRGQTTASRTGNSSSPMQSKSAGPTSVPPLPRFPRSSFLSGSKRKPVVLNDSSSDEDDLSVSAPPKLAPPCNRQSPGDQSAERQSSSSVVHVEDDSDDVAIAPTPLGRRRGRKRTAPVAVTEDSDEDDVVQTLPAKRRRLAPKEASTSGSSEDSHNEDSRETRVKARTDKAPSTPAGRALRKPAVSARSAKKKQMELLRRRRAGEVIDEKDLSSSEDDTQKGIYDTDSDNMALSTFEDDEEEQTPTTKEQQPSKKATKKEKGKKKKEKSKETSSKDVSQDEDDDGCDDDGDLDDFVVEDDDAPLGVPAAFLDIPLEFTAHAHKPLKEHFQDVVQWLVLAKLHPGFAERKHGLYTMGWRKLDDEVRGLAESKFSSSAWKSDFFLALRARPGITTDQLLIGDKHELETCMACGRSNHPARWVVNLYGPAYYKNATQDNFLEDVDSDESSSSESEGGDDSGRDYDYDENGNHIPKEGKRWFVGSVCNSNAETAHTLIHWKHNLKDWVDGALEAEGYMQPQKLQEREKMKPKKRYKLVDVVIDTWTKNGVLRDLFHEFKQTLEMARNKSTTGKAAHNNKW